MLDPSRASSSYLRGNLVGLEPRAAGSELRAPGPGPRAVHTGTATSQTHVKNLTVK